MKEAEKNNETTTPRRSRIGRKVFNVSFYGTSGLCGLWIAVSILVHLYGSKDIRRTRPAIHAAANKPEELYRCWESLYTLFDGLVYDYGREITLMRRHNRDLKSTWGEKYGWDLLPISQLPSRDRTREGAGTFRFKMIQTWSWCRLGEAEVVERSPILEKLREAYESLDLLRIALTKRMRSFAEPKRVRVEGGTQTEIRALRANLKAAGRQSIKLMRSRGKTPDLSKLRKWRLKRTMK